tara:strand:+ start:17912 stop:19588 length:1677 start_codon:yes stop_codon:yes gene_type:complete
MGTLNNRFQYAWYGTCGEQEKCKPYVFKENPAQLIDAVEMVSSFTTNSANNSPLYYKPEIDEGDLASLECGGMYSFTLRPGKSLNIPGLTAAGSETIKVGENQLASKISFTCAGVFDTTPSPTVAQCIPDSFTSFRITSANQLVSVNGINQRFIFFAVNDQIGIDTSFLSSAIASDIRIQFPNGVTSQIIMTGLKPKEEGGMFYVDKGTGCYGGAYELVNGNWEVNLALLSGEDSDPEPQPTPTAKPALDCKCAPDNFTDINITGSSVTTGGNNFAGFQTGTIVSYDPSTLKSEGIACTVELNFPNGTNLGLIVINGKVPNNTQFYVKHGNTCYTATASSSNKSSGGDWSLATVVSKNLSTGCGDDLDVPDPDPTPTPKPAPEPTPTPKPQQTGDCCPSTNRTLNTDGSQSTIEVTDILEGQGKSVTTLKYVMWEDGGKLCVDMTDLENAEVSDSEVARYYSLPSNPSVAVGGLTRVYKNNKNTFYYTSANNVCYEAEYSADGQDWQNPVVMQESSIQSEMGFAQDDVDSSGQPIVPLDWPTGIDSDSSQEDDSYSGY